MWTKGPWRTFVCCATVAMSLAAGAAAAQENIKPDQWKKMYDDALVELKASQDRKSELAKQNERLVAEVERLRKDLDASRAETAVLRTQAAVQSQRSFLLRSHYTAWRSFLYLYPGLEMRWRLFVGADLLEANPFDMPADSAPTPPAADPAGPLTSSDGPEVG